MNKFTPGPWRVEKDGGYGAPVVADVWLSEASRSTAKMIICRAIDNTGPYSDPDQSLGNANLIAAAPEMYAACESALKELLDVLHSTIKGQVHHDGDEFHAAIEALKSALAKARGEQ